MQLNTNYIPDDTSLYLNNSQLLTVDNYLSFNFNDQTNLNSSFDKNGLKSAIFV